MSWVAWLIAGFVVFWILCMVWILRTTSKPLPPLDRTPRTATVIGIVDENDSDMVLVEYEDAEGERHRVGLADLIHDSWIGKFTPGSTWQVYGFRTPTSRVLLTEEHDDVLRCGYTLSGIRLGGESGPVTVGPGSPFLNGKWTFEE